MYRINDISEVVYSMGDYEGTLKNKYDEISMKTKLLLNLFGSTFGTLRFDKKTVLYLSLSFTPYWDYKTTNAIHADRSGV